MFEVRPRRSTRFPYPEWSCEFPPLSPQPPFPHQPLPRHTLTIQKQTPRGQPMTFWHIHTMLASFETFANLWTAEGWMPSFEWTMQGIIVVEGPYLAKFRIP